MKLALISAVSGFVFGGSLFGAKTLLTAISHHSRIYLTCGVSGVSKYFPLIGFDSPFAAMEWIRSWMRHRDSSVHVLLCEAHSLSAISFVSDA